MSKRCEGSYTPLAENRDRDGEVGRVWIVTEGDGGWSWAAGKVSLGDPLPKDLVSEATR